MSLLFNFYCPYEEIDPAVDALLPIQATDPNVAAVVKPAKDDIELISFISSAISCNDCSFFSSTIFTPISSIIVLAKR